MQVDGIELCPRGRSHRWRSVYSGVLRVSVDSSARGWCKPFRSVGVSTMQQRKAGPEGVCASSRRRSPVTRPVASTLAAALAGAKGTRLRLSTERSSPASAPAAYGAGATWRDRGGAAAKASRVSARTSWTHAAPARVRRRPVPTDGRAWCRRGSSPKANARPARSGMLS